MSKSPKNHIAVTHPRPVDLLVALLTDFARGHKNGTVLAAVCGAGATGKSTLCRALGQRLQNAPVVRLDDYNRPRAERRESGLLGSHPKGIKLDLLGRHLAALKNGRAIEKPVYDPVDGHDHATETIPWGPIVLLDGEAASFAALRRLLDFVIFVEADPETSLAVRLSRDVEERGYDREKVMRVFTQSNLTDFPEHGAPARDFANVILHFNASFEHTVVEVAEEHLGHRAFVDWEFEKTT